MLGVLVGDIPGRHDTALKLLHPLLQQFCSQCIRFTLKRTLNRAIRLCFHLLEENPDTMIEDQIRSRNLALLIYIIADHRFWDTRDSFTAAQFDLLIDYHLNICEGTDYHLIQDTFWMLEHGSSNNPERMRRYIDTIMRFMGEEITCQSALRAAMSVRVEIASMTQHDKSLREDFSKALALVALLDPARPRSAGMPSKTLFVLLWDDLYLQLLCALVQDPTWHVQLHQHGHFDNCLAIVKTLSTNGSVLLTRPSPYAASVARIFAVIDALGDQTNPLFNVVQVYPRWPLLLHAWKYIFNTDFFRWEDNWVTLSRQGYLDGLSSLIAYARKQLNDGDEPLLVLVEQVCRKLDEEKQQRGQGDARHIHDRSHWYKEISDLGNQIRALLDASLTDV